MTIVGIIGGLGTGKTALLTYMLKALHEKYNYYVFSNYHLKGIPFYYFTKIDDFDRLNKKDGNVIGLDEIHVSADSRSSMSPLIIDLARKILQSRKMSAMLTPTHLFFTAQLISSVEYRIRSSDICNSLWKPKILAKDDVTNRPLLMSVDVYVPDPMKIDEFKYRTKFHLKGISLYEICDYYDTSEIVESIQDNTLRTYAEKYLDKLPGAIKTKEEIEAYIKAKEPRLSRSFIKDVAVLLKLMDRDGKIFEEVGEEQEEEESREEGG